jgi:hypothetical protein
MQWHRAAKADDALTSRRHPRAYRHAHASFTVQYAATSTLRPKPPRRVPTPRSPPRDDAWAHANSHTTLRRVAMSTPRPKPIHRHPRTAARRRNARSFACERLSVRPDSSVQTRSPRRRHAKRPAVSAYERRLTAARTTPTIREHPNARKPSGPSPPPTPDVLTRVPNARTPIHPGAGECTDTPADVPSIVRTLASPPKAINTDARRRGRCPGSCTRGR